MKRLSLALAALLSVGAANASPVTFSFGLPLTLNTTEINLTGQLGLFDTSLGTLTSATLTLFGGARLSFSGSNGAAQSQIAALTSSTNITYTSSIGALSSLFTGPITLMEATGPLSYASGQTRNFGPIDKNDSQVYSVLGGAAFAALQAAGGGLFDIGCTSLSGLAVQGGGGNFNTTQGTTAGCGASITYVYTTTPPPGVPEPATLALVGLALAGASLVTRRRRQG